jgi:hypothetical protein
LKGPQKWVSNYIEPKTKDQQMEKRRRILERNINEEES